MSVHEHLSDDVLIDALYGLADPSGPADVDARARVRECPVCAFRWNQLLEMRAVITVPLETGAAELAAQRRKIYHRIEHPSRMRWAGPAAAAAACLIAIGMLIHRPVAPVRPEITEIGDTQLFSDVYSDVYSMEQSFEPSATASFGALFESDAAQAEGANQSSNQGVNQ